ncbi:glucosamine-6-phosphate isomerase [Chryseobacterium sp. StRB126]|nr:glucosamine-6-phosphate isomerase [Chryseobacterium sp. StRB126]
MIQFILMLLGLAFPNNNAHTTTDNNQTPDIVVTYSESEQGMDDGGPVGGNTGQTPP